VTFVIDNSVALSWCFEDERTPQTTALLDRVTRTGAVAPLLWPLEALNALLMAERRRRFDAAKRRVFADFLRELPIAIDSETAVQAWDAIAGLAERFGLTSYDAAYLELAQRRGLPLATLDRDLQAAAKQIGVEVLTG
jgi:predicted nucleic acid-binding protein